MVGKARSRELCEALELAPSTLQTGHFRFFTSNHSRPIAATINTMMTLQGVDEVGSSLGVDGAAAVEGAFFGAVGTAGTVGGLTDACVGVVWLLGSDFGNAPLIASSSSLPNDAS